MHTLLEKCADTSVLFLRLAVLFFASEHPCYFFHFDVKIVDEKTPCKHELSVCAIFYAFSNYAPLSSSSMLSHPSPIFHFRNYKVYLV